MKAFVLAITFVLLSNLSFAEEVISIQARQDVAVPVLLVKPTAPSTVAIIMLAGTPGGREGSFFRVSPDDGSIKKSRSFLLRTVDQFADRGFSVAVMNPPENCGGESWSVIVRTNPRTSCVWSTPGAWHSVGDRTPHSQ